MLMDEVTKRRLDHWIGPESFTVITTDNGRQIQLYYEREVEVLPGLEEDPQVRLHRRPAADLVTPRDVRRPASRGT